jgi:hypothetical protein
LTVLSILAFVLGAGRRPSSGIVALELMAVTTRATPRSTTTSATLSRRRWVIVKATTTTQPNQNGGACVGTGEFLGKLGGFVTSIKDKERNVFNVFRMSRRNREVLVTEQGTDLLNSN